MRTNKAAGSAAQPKKRKPLIRKAPKPPAPSYEFPTIEVYTRTSLKLQELAESLGMTRRRLATLALDYALGKLESGEVKISDSIGPINFTVAGGFAA